jgi:hypothetical protein
MGLPPKSSSGPSPHRSLCAFVDGFSLHAATFVPTHDRAALERLLRDILRPAIAAERVSLREDGRVEARVRDPGHLGCTELPRRIVVGIDRIDATHARAHDVGKIRSVGGMIGDTQCR